ncbi:MAG: S-adenosylmethionine:tRNA ribosyltransferase-isomerase [Bacteroidales bacterium]|nr:S-adenosylmethionine:tRNA ribosyltransferase-isomerase [Bacteroidales bacterium]
MPEAGKIKISEYNYSLPEGRIAKYPLKDRDLSKLLIYNKGTLSTSSFKYLPKFLPAQSLIVYNDTKVIHARLQFKKITGAFIEIFCLEPFLPTDYERSLESQSGVQWKCMIGNQKKWKSGDLQHRFHLNGVPITLNAKRLASPEGSNVILFTWDPGHISFAEILEVTGTIPIPPYLNRKAEKSDSKRYQTVYADKKGSVAAPTAGLHFTPDILNDLTSKGFLQEKITLHVGAGTFKPVSSETLEEHNMHTEHFSISREFLSGLIRIKGPILAVGTTSVRSLESLYWLGLKAGKNGFKPHVDQWEPYKKIAKIKVKDSLDNLLEFMNSENINNLEASTQILIIPGYKFRIVKGLITNFHQPKSTLLLLIAAFIGNDWKKMYEYALNHDFRFLSYGDSSLLLPQ